MRLFGWELSLHRVHGSFDLGYGYICPICRIPQDEGQQTGVYWHRVPVCGSCVDLVKEVRKDYEENNQSGVYSRRSR